MNRILIYAQTPPPVHGQSVMTAHLVDGLRATGQLDLAAPSEAAETAAALAFYHVNPQISDGLDDIGRWNARKIARVFRFIAAAIRARFVHRLDTLYFIPAPAKREALYRDWAVLLLCRGFFDRLVLHWHCIGQPEFIEEQLNWPERVLAHLLYGNAALSICLSNYSRSEAAHFLPERTVLVPNGIPDPCPDFDSMMLPECQRRAETFARAVADNEPCHREVLFLAGRMTGKGLFDALAAVTLANRHLAEQKRAWRFRLTVAGPFEDDEERERYERAAAELNSTAASGRGPLAVWAGWADEARKRELYRAADIFIFPTTYPAESFGLVLAEAMAHGCAVITTRWQAVPEVLPSGYPHIVAPHDIEGMASALALCAVEPPDRILRDYFLARFTLRRFVDDMVDVLSKIDEPREV